MKFAIAIAASALAALAGCANHPIGHPLADRSYGSWLDEVGRLPNPRVPMSDEEAAEFRTQAIALRAQADALRVQLAAETDRVKRIDDYVQLRKINDRLAPIERVLLDAGRPLRAATQG